MISGLRRAITICDNHDALKRISENEIAALTEAATSATYYRDGLAADQIAAIRRVVEISTACCKAAAHNEWQHFVAALIDGRLTGYVIATRHGPDDLELDWIMVHPDQHGSGIAADLIRAGIAWLGVDKPLWLNVIRHNERAIRFYRKLGFEIDPDAVIHHAIPHWIMRRRPI